MPNIEDLCSDVDDTYTYINNRIRRLSILTMAINKTADKYAGESDNFISSIRPLIDNIDAAIDQLKDQYNKYCLKS
jgi:molecular chaperone GrpE (heat shock protein)